MQTLIYVCTVCACISACMSAINMNISNALTPKVKSQVKGLFSKVLLLKMQIGLLSV